MTAVTLFVLLLMSNYQEPQASVTAVNPLITQYGEKAMPRRAATDGSGKANKSDPQKDKGDVVITPAGPMPKENVHKVGPNEVVRRNDDGTYTIVRKSKD
ncbi:MAG: hypothetical protein WAK31_29425 [Chthoniobacterales bacterium]